MNKNSRVYRSLRAAKRAFFDEDVKASAPKKPEEPAKKAVENTSENSSNVKEDPAAARKALVIRDDSIKTVECLNEKYCCGCGACANVCPVGAIEMKLDDEGFYAPVIDRDKCTECGLCKKLCPSINTVYKNNDKPTCYAAYANDEIRAKSSSGGIFTVLANYIFSHGGYVCGAAYDEEFNVKHIIISDPADLDKLRKSKYVQSNAGFVYKEIKKLLQADKYVLFCGCGCQVAGLYAALGNMHYAKLYTIDLMCHGGPSPGLFKKYLDEHYDRDKLSYVGFREKDYFGWSTEMTVNYKDGSVLRNSRVMDPFYKAFLPCISTREFCGDCAFAKLPRQGDITLADFWGVDKYDKALTDGKGTSIVSINSEQGAFIWKEIKRDLVLCADLSLEKVLSTGQPFDHCFKNHPARAAYFDQIKKGSSMEKAYDYAVKRKFDVGIFGMWYGDNYGSVATYYALHEIISSFGLSVIMIDKPGMKPGDREQDAGSHARRFANEHYEISRSYSPRDLRQLNNHIDTFVVGSDQVWNRGVNRFAGFSFYLDFVESSKKRISYASSFGHGTDFSSPIDRETVRRCFEAFDGISVRESSGVDFLKDVYNVDAVRVLDPVFVADRKTFDKLVESTDLYKKHDANDKFFTAYILDPTPEKRQAVLHVAEKTGLKPIVMLDGRSLHLEEDIRVINMDDNLVTVTGVEEWLYYFKCSDFVLTDSCHGMSFSIIFDRPFIAMGNTHRGITRFESLTKLLGLESHFVYEASEIMTNESLFDEIDYGKVHEILEAERERSLSWLKERLFEPKTISSYCAYSVVDERLK